MARRDPSDVSARESRDEAQAARCPRCGHLWATADEAVDEAVEEAVDGERAERTERFVNEAGYAFTVRLYERAPGCLAAGETSRWASWYPGNSWQRAFCRECSRHAGWLFASNSRRFFALIER